MPIITIFIVLLVIGLILFLINKYAPIDGKIKTIINWVAIIIAIIWLLDVFGVLNILESAKI